MTRLALASLLLVALLMCGRASAAPTPLLEDDLRANKRTTIDGPKDDLDAVLGGSSGFSTQELGRVEDRLREALKRDRPRATPRLVVFMYPGAVSAERLRAMREIFVDIELTIDPCSRTVCDEALARHLELVGRAVGSAVVKSQSFSIVYKNLSLKAETDVRGDELITLSVPVAEAIAASQKDGGGRALLASRRRAETEYTPLMVKAIAQRAIARRVPLGGPPWVTRAGDDVQILLKLKTDRSRQEQQLLDALGATGEALRASPATPHTGRIELTSDTGSRGSPPTRYRCAIEPAQLYADGKLDARSLLGSYVEKVNDDKNAQRMDLDDSKGPSSSDGPEPDDNEAISVLSSNFSTIGACAKAEASANPRFRGVTLVIGWSSNGRAASVDVKEPALKSGALPGCLRRAMAEIMLPRFGGPTRTIEYPIRLK